jgi:hypothetical protein
MQRVLRAQLLHDLAANAIHIGFRRVPNAVISAPRSPPTS